MKRHFILFFLIISTIIGYSQLPTLPVGNPNPSSNGYMRYGYVRSDSGWLVPRRDTMWKAIRPAVVYWERAGVDTAFWYYNMTKWQKLNGGSGVGTVTSISLGVGIIGTPDPITTTGNIAADTGRGNSQLITGASLNSVADSIGDLIDLKPNVGDVILNQLAKQTGKRFDIQSGKFDSLYASTATGLILANNSAAEIGRFGAGGGTTVTWQGLNTFSGGATINGTTTIGSLSGILKASTGVVGTAVSGTDLKTINGTSIIGSGDIVTPDNGITALTGDVTASGSGSVVATLATVNGNVGTFKKATVTANGKGLVTAISEGFGVDTVYRKAGQDSIFYTINGGTERAVKDSVGGGGGGGVTSDSLAVRKSGPNLIHIISHNSGYNSTTVGSSGLANRRDSANLFLGLRAGQNGTTGYQNIGIGRAALKSTTTSNVNIAIGDSAMANGVGTGTGFNTAIGYRSLVANTSGVGNIGLGYNTLAANTTGSFNIAIGGDALAAKTTASTGPDIAIGSNALGAILGGGTGNNIAIGTNALAGNNTNSKSYNIGIGDLSLNKLTSGTYNVGVGSVTLQQLTTGTNNIHVGAGTFNTGPTTGSYNIMIGGSSGGDARLPNNTGTIFIGGANLGAYTLGAETTTIGYRANRNTGAQSTAIGYNALYTAGTPISDVGSVALGYNAGSATAGAAVNDRDYGVYIGHSAASNGSITTYTGQELIAIGYQSAQSQSAGDYNIAIGRVNLASLTGSNQLAIGGNGIGWIRQDVSGSLRRTLINATTSNVTTFTASAALEVNGIAGGFLPPRLTTGERNAIASPAAGLSVYNSSLATNDVYTTAWYQQPNGLTGSGTLDFPSTGAHSSSDLTITVTGAADGDIVILGVPNASVTNESNYTAWVSIANTVTVRYNHYGSGTNNPASGLFKVYVIKN